MEAVMKKALLVTIVGAFILLQAPLVSSEEKVSSLRGDYGLDKPAKPIKKKKQKKSGDGIERNWKLQPPSIPHSVKKDRITLKGNTCLKCHAKANAEKEKAPSVSDSHFVTRDMKVLDKLSPRRYFCRQCHAPQADVKPLVENTFETNDIELNNLLMEKTK